MVVIGVFWDDYTLTQEVYSGNLNLTIMLYPYEANMFQTVLNPVYIQMKYVNTLCEQDKDKVQVDEKELDLWITKSKLQSEKVKRKLQFCNQDVKNLCNYAYTEHKKFIDYRQKCFITLEQKLSLPYKRLRVGELYVENASCDYVYVYVYIGKGDFMRIDLNSLRNHFFLIGSNLDYRIMKIKLSRYSVKIGINLCDFLYNKERIKELKC